MFVGIYAKAVFESPTHNLFYSHSFYSKINYFWMMGGGTNYIKSKIYVTTVVSDCGGV